MTIQESDLLWERFKKLDPAIQRDIFCWLWGWIVGQLVDDDYRMRRFGSQTMEAIAVKVSNAEEIAKAHKTETTTP